MPDDPLRLVLFGLPGAGKSSLLGALDQAAEVQPHLLNGRLADPSPNLVGLRRAVYEHGPAPTAEEIVPYAFTYEPADKGGRGPVAAVVLDCDGRAADALVRQPTPAAGALAKEMLHADGLVLAVDASDPPDKLDADFAEFDRFLRRVENDRGLRTDVGGLPVFLVLTKCDRLARPGESTADWLEHIEGRKRDIGARFRGFLAGRRPAAFGRVHVHVWATAVVHPPLAGGAAKPTDPYGVAELFRQCIDQAAAFRDRREHSDHRLAQLTITAVGGFLVLAALTGSLVVADAMHRPPTELETRVESLRYTEARTPEERLRGTPERLRPRLKEWQEIHDAADFASLPADLRALVENRESELADYIPWLEGLEETPRPREALTEEELHAVQARLAGPLAPPRPGWDETDAGQLRRQLAAEAEALLRAVASLRTWYQHAYAEADALWTFSGHTAGGPDWNGWDRDAERLLAPAMKPPFADTDAVADVTPPLTYAAVEEFGSVAAARAGWEAARGRLRRLRDVGAALGLIEGPKGKPDVLVVPADGLTLAQADGRAREMQAAYPEYAAEFAQDAPLPQAVADDVRRRARANYDRLLEPARALVLDRLRAAPSGDPTAPDAETPARWRPVREWLNDPKELAGWRALAGPLARLADAPAADPASALAAFLDEKSFSIDLESITVVIPDELEVKPRPGEALTVYHGPGGGEAHPALVFRAADDGARVGERPLHAYAFQALKPGQKIDYAPGDALYAELPLRDRRTLRWDERRSRLYRFEALRTEPSLRGTDADDVKKAEGVRLRFSPEAGAPKVPELMPAVEIK